MTKKLTLKLLDILKKGDRNYSVTFTTAPSAKQKKEIAKASELLHDESSLPAVLVGGVQR